MVVSYLLKCLSRSGGRAFLVKYGEKHLESSGLTVNTTTIVWYSLVNSEQTPPGLSEVLVLSVLVLLEAHYGAHPGMRCCSEEFQLFWQACCMMTEHRLNICRYSSAPSNRHLPTT